MKKSNTTIDDLAVMVAKGFEETRGDIANLDGKVEKIDERMRVVEKKLDRALYTELTHLEARVARLEQKTGIKSSS